MMMSLDAKLQTGKLTTLEIHMQKKIVKRIVISAESIANGGAERIAINLANKLSNKYNVGFLPFEDKSQYMVGDKVSILGRRNRITYSKFIDFISCIIFALKNSSKTDVIISNMIRPNLIFCIAKILRGGDVICVHHSSFRRIKNIALRFFVSALYARATKVVCISEDMLLDYQSILKNNNGVLIHNPHEIEKINILSKEIVSDFTFNKNNHYFCMVGRILPLKRIDDFLKALSALPENIHGLIIGTGSNSELKRVESMIINLGLENKVFLLGSRVNPFPYIKQCTACILCSETEGFPNILVESISLGVPVIASNCTSGPKELIKPNSFDCIPEGDIVLGENGILFNVGDVSGLIKGIKTIIVENNFDPIALHNNSMFYNADAIIGKYETYI